MNGLFSDRLSHFRFLLVIFKSYLIVVYVVVVVVFFSLQN